VQLARDPGWGGSRRFRSGVYKRNDPGLIKRKKKQEEGKGELGVCGKLLKNLLRGGVGHVKYE